VHEPYSALSITCYAMGFRLAPENLGGRHIEWLMRYWTADPTLGPELASRGMRQKALQLRQTPYSASYIRQQLSFLRAFCIWIGKPGLILPAHHYVDDVSLVQPTTEATHDRTRDAQEVDFDAILARVRAVDPRVALQLEVMKAYGLQRKEAILFSPSSAEVPAHALLASAGPGPFLMFVRISRGTRGGKLRFTAIRTPEQERALVHAREYAPAPGAHIGHPGLTLQQALKRFSNVLNRAGVNRKVMGITPHGLRHQFESDLFVELTDIPPPIRRGEVHLSPEALQKAYLKLALQLRPPHRPGLISAHAGPGGKDMMMLAVTPGAC
jgi:integrase